MSSIIQRIAADALINLAFELDSWLLKQIGEIEFNKIKKANGSSIYSIEVLPSANEMDSPIKTDYVLCKNGKRIAGFTHSLKLQIK